MSYQSVEEARALLPSLSQERQMEFRNRRSSQKPVLKALFPSQTATVRTQNGSSSRYSFIYTCLNPHSKRKCATDFKYFLAFVIVCDIITYILSTDLRISSKYPGFFTTSEAMVSTIFMTEYVLRVITCVEHRRYQPHGPVFGRLRFMLTFPALFDLFVTLPFFVELLIPVELPQLTFLRVFRLARIMKTEGLIQALDAVYRVIYYNRDVLLVALWVCLALILSTAVMLYLLRPIEGRKVDELDDFHSIPATLYLATLMLTGQGGPDADELPWYTRSIVLVTAVFSVAMFAIPASMLTWGFEAEAERMAKRARRRALKQRSGYCSSSEEDSQDESTDTDEEYFKIIAGEEDESEEEETERMKQIREAFMKADVNADGTLTLAEVSKMQNLPFGGESTNILAERIEKLEAQVQDNADKLDRIIELLAD